MNKYISKYKLSISSKKEGSHFYEFTENGYHRHKYNRVLNLAKAVTGKGRTKCKFYYELAQRQSDDMWLVIDHFFSEISWNEIKNDNHI